jgi:hypothetical protein
LSGIRHLDARLLVETGRVGAGGASDVLNTIEVKSWDKLS